jgi:hypothetical protein
MLILILIKRLIENCYVKKAMLMLALDQKAAPIRIDFDQIWYQKSS